MSTDKQTAFMQAYARCHEPFLRYCSAVAYGKMDVQDLVQDVLLSTFQRFDHVEKKEDLLHYLIKAARYRAISEWRLLKRSGDITAKQAERLRAQGVSAETLVDVGILYETLDKLPAVQRDALVLFEVSGLSMAEIAEIQQCSEGSVKTRVSRARATLRSRLEGTEGAGQRLRAEPAAFLTLLTLLQ